MGAPFSCVIAPILLNLVFSVLSFAGSMLGSLVSSASCDICMSLLASDFPESVSKVPLSMLCGSAERRTRRIPYSEELIFVFQVMYNLKDNAS